MVAERNLPRPPLCKIILQAAVGKTRSHLCVFQHRKQVAALPDAPKRIARQAFAVAVKQIAERFVITCLQRHGT